MTTYSRTAPGSALHRGALVLLVSMLAGLLAAGITFPLVGGLGLLARSGAESFEKLPAELAEGPLPQRTKILAADGTVLANIYLNENRILAKIDDMPEHLLYAIIAIEDARFYEHSGVDLRGLARAFVRNSQAGTVTQGGSTITQQYVKNVLIVGADDKAGKKAAVERSTHRKIQEARYAIALERQYSKRQILEKYLNIAYFGNGVYGVGTAAQYYFRKPVKALTLDEAALLAGLVQNPERTNPVKNPKNARDRRNVVLKRMAEVGFVERAVVEKAIAKPAPKIVPQQLTGIEDNKVAPAFLDYFRTYFLADPRFGDTPGERATKLFQGGLTIKTTLDPKLQAVAQRTVRETLPLRSDPAAAAVVVKPGTGHVVAMAVSNNETKSTKVNLATSKTFQPGSTFKTFTLAAAVEEGLPLRLRIPSPARYRADSSVCDNPRDGFFRNAGDSEAGNFDLPTATWLSVNTYYIQLQNRVGLDKVANMARKMGIQFDDPVGRRECSLTLGARSVSPLEMASAYATLAAEGVYCKPTPIIAVQAPNQPLQTIEPDCQRVLEPGVANTVTSVLRGVIDGSHPHRTGRGATIGRPAAGKTGTTNSSRAAWFTGYTPDYATAVWMGHPTTLAPLRNVHGVRTVYGGTFPATMWRKIMGFAHTNLPVRDFPVPPARAVFGEQVSVPDLRGITVEAAAEILEDLGLSYTVDSRPVQAAPIPAGLVGAQRPGAGLMVVKGTTIVLFLSDGTSPPVPTVTPTPTAVPTVTPSSTPSPKPTASPSPSPKTCQGNADKCQTPTPTPTPTPSPTPSGGGGTR